MRPFAPSLVRPLRRILAALGLCLLPITSPAAVLVDCDAGIPGGDNLQRGFYLPDFPGSALDGLDVFLSSSVAGAFEFRLTVREGAYDGPLVAEAEVALELSGTGDDSRLAAFAFPSVPVTPGSTLTFAVTRVAGPTDGLQFFDTHGSTDCPFIETNGRVPPLDSFKRQGIRAALHGSSPSPVEGNTWSRVKAAYR